MRPRAAVLAATGASEDELGLAALDVSIVAPDGTEIEPAAPVDVSLEVKSLPEAVEDGTPLDVQHLTGPSAPAGVASAASPGAVPEGAHGDAAGAAAAMAGQTEGTDATTAVETVASDVTVSNGGAVAAFTVSSFSTFTITWNKGIVTRATLTVHHVDQAGAEIQAPDQQDVTIKDDLTLDLDSYATDAVAGYTYAGAHLDAPDGATVTTVTFAASGVLGFNSAVTFRDGATTVREQSGTVLGDVITADVYLVYARQMTSVSAQTPDGTYTVTVTYGPEAGLPAGTQVSVSTLDEDAAESVRAQIASAQAAHYDGYDQDGLRIVGAPLDISLTADGAEVEPAAGSSVHVTISAQVLPEDADFPTLQSRAEVQHVTDSGDVQTVADAVGTDGGRVAVRTDGVTADFDVSSFSTFTITYYWRIFAVSSFSRIYVVDESGASIGNDDSESAFDTRKYVSDLANDANPSSEDYTFVQARVGSSFASATTALSSTSGYIAYNGFNNWVYSPDAQSVDAFGSSQNLYLVYRKAPKRVTITFNANGGSASAPAAQTALVDATITLPDYTGTRAGYVFMGWSTAKNLATTSYADLYPAGSAYTVPDANTTLYAVWSSTAKATATFYVRLDATIPAEPGAYPGSNYSDGIRLNENIDMKRWIVDTDSTKPLTTTGAKNAKGERNYLENDVTANLVSVPTNEQLATVINGRTARTGLAVRATADGELEVTSITKGNNYDLTSLFSVGDRLYVHWYVQKAQDRAVNWHVDGSLRVKSRIGITYDGNPNSAATNVPISYQEVAGTTVTVGASGSKNGTVKTPSRAGYVFEGWNTSADGNGTTYQPGDSLTLNENTVLYAMWSKGLNRMTVHKQDEAGAILSGATFSLEERSGDAWLPVTSGTTDGQGVFSFPSVRSQTIYRLTETYAPNGFVTRNAVCFEVTTGADGKELGVFVVDESGQQVATPDWLTVAYAPSSVAGGSAQLSITIRDEQIRRQVVFVKTAEDGTTPLAGAQFTLTRGSGDAQTTVSGVLTDASNDAGVFSASDATLTYGTYTLTETAAPSGYQTTEPITLTLNDYVSEGDTGMTVTGDASVRCDATTSVQGGVSTTTYTYKVTVRDAPLACVTVLKTDDKTPATTLSGATFKLTRSVNGADQAVVITGATNDAGQFTIADSIKDTGVTLGGLVDGTYRLKELVAPPGYVTATSDVVFTVTRGTVALDAEGGGNAAATLTGSGSDVTLSIANTPGKPLPNTGGPGSRPFALAGGGLVIMALIGLLASRHRAEGGYG
ncbi:InlB B-repeat-containing protein [bacterium]|nr:InlB B-repeat-containing protein [bacterium]